MVGQNSLAPSPSKGDDSGRTRLCPICDDEVGFASRLVIEILETVKLRAVLQGFLVRTHIFSLDQTFVGLP